MLTLKNVTLIAQLLGQGGSQWMVVKTAMAKAESSAAPIASAGLEGEFKVCKKVPRKLYCYATAMPN